MSRAANQFNDFSARKFIALFFILSISNFPISLHAKEKVFVVGFAQDTLANDWRASQVKEVKAAFKKYPNVKFIHTDGQGRTAKQILDIENLALQNVDLIMTSPRDAKAMTPVISKIYHSGIPVVLITRKIMNDDFSSFVSPDDEEIARNAAKFIATKTNQKSNILMMRGVPTATTAIARTKGFTEELKKYPNMKIVADKNGNYLRSTAIRVMEDVLSNDIKFDTIFAQSDSMASGARMVLQKSGIDPSSVLIVGIDYISEAQRAIRNGLQTASFKYPTCASEAVQVAMKILLKQKYRKYIKVDSQLITKSNVDKIQPIF